MINDKNTDSGFCNNCFIKVNTGFKYLNNEQIELVNYEKSFYSYKRGDIIFHEGNKNSGVFCIFKGIVKIYKTGQDGKEHIVRLAKRGNLLGLKPVFCNDISGTTAQAVTNCQICFIPSGLFLSIVKNNCEFANYIIKKTFQKLDKAYDIIINLAQKNLKERVAETILYLYESFGVDNNKCLRISLTREELANIVGTATESVIRQLSELKKEKIIKLRGRTIIINDIEKLRKINKNFD